MNKLPIYKAEVEAGLKEKILSTASITTASSVEIVDPFECSILKAIAENKDQVDLYYLKSILVSTGWNKNDDVFDRSEVWSARATPEDKPFNYEHDQSQIIGHITACKAIAADGTLIPEDISIDELPSKFHISTSAVLYKFWEDLKKQEMMNNIINEIAQGKWFVSMEALFSNFDYAIIDGVNSKVVARNEDTAFLTKHLRAYGGTGIYNNLKVGRLLRNITFSGKGLVRKPANPESVILKENEAFKSNSGYVLSEIVQIKENIVMKNENVEEKKVEVVQASVGNQGSGSQGSEKPIDVEINNQLIEANKKIEELHAEASMWNKEKDEMNKKMTEANKMYEELKANFEATLSELNNMKKEKKANDRLSMVMEKMGMPKEEAVTVVNSLETLADEAFANVVAMQGDYMKKKMEEYKKAGVAAEENNEETEVKPSEDNIEEDPAEAKASTSALDTAEVKLDAALATSEGNSDVDKVASQIASYFGLDKSATE